MATGGSRIGKCSVQHPHKCALLLAAILASPPATGCVSDTGDGSALDAEADTSNETGGGDAVPNCAIPADVFPIDDSGTEDLWWGCAPMPSVQSSCGSPSEYYVLCKAQYLSEEGFGPTPVPGVSQGCRNVSGPEPPGQAEYCCPCK